MRLRIIITIALFALSGVLIRSGASALGIAVKPALALILASAAYLAVFYLGSWPAGDRARAVFRWTGVLGLFVGLNGWALVFRDEFTLPVIWIASLSTMAVCLLAFRSLTAPGR